MALYNWQQRTAVALLLCMPSACSLFVEDEGCELGASSCDGSSVRMCVPDVTASSSPPAARPAFSRKKGEAEKGRWEVQRDCGDDELLGPSTCGFVEGMPACVAKREDVEPVPVSQSMLKLDEAPARWWRVDVRHEVDGDQYAVVGVAEVTLPSRPLAALQATIAVVSYAEEVVLDAAGLVFTDELEAVQSAWLQTDPRATRLALVAPGSEGQVLFELPRPVQPAAMLNAAGLAQVNQALEASWPGGLTITPASAPASLLQVLAPVFRLVPAGLLTLVREVSMELDLEAASFATKHSAEDIKQLQAAAAGSAPQLTLHPLAPRRVAVARNVLGISMGVEDIKSYVRDPNALAFEVTRALGGAYAKTIVREGRDAQASAIFGKVRTFDAFASTVAPYLQSRVSPLLQKGETLEQAWNSLHQSAVSLGMARPYASGVGGGTDLERAALAGGFASLAGTGDPIADLVEYVAHVAVPSTWEFGPCAAIRASTVDELPPQYILALAKIAAVRGLGLVTAEQFQACAGELRIGGSEGLVFHRPDGEKLPFTTEFKGVYQPFFAGQVHVSWVAHRGYLSTSLDLGYRGALAPALRLSTEVSSAGEDIRTGDSSGALLAMVNATSYQVIKATGGMVVATQIFRDADRQQSRDRLEGLAFFVTLSDPIWGTNLYPLVTAKADKPIWGDAP